MPAACSGRHFLSGGWQADGKSDHMRRVTLFQIAGAGWYVVVPLVVLIFALHAVLGWWATVPVLVLLVPVVLFFRDRPCHVAAEPLAIIAPMDGEVTHRRECYDPFLDREAIRVTIRLSLFGAYYFRSPVEGTMLELDSGAVDMFDGAMSWIRTDEGDDILIAASRGPMFGARPCRGGYGERVGQGRCCGTRRLARQVDVYMPAHSRVLVDLHARVQAGATVLGKLVRKEAST